MLIKFLFFYKKNTRTENTQTVMGYILDPCGMLTSTLVYLLMGWAGYQVTRLLDPLESPVDALVWLVFAGLLGMATWCHWATMLADPGYVPVFPPVCVGWYMCCCIVYL
jgi:hypothetical protein